MRPSRSGRSIVDVPVEAARPEQRGVEDVRAVRRRHQDHRRPLVEPVHLDQELVQRLLALVVTAAETGAAVTTDCVDLVDEHDRRRVLLGLLEQVAHARGADADEHLDEVRTADRIEGNPGLTRDGSREQRLSRPRWSEQQHAARDLRPHRLELGGVLQVLLDLLQLLDRLVDARDVLERRLRLVLADELRARLAELHHPSAAALRLIHDEDEGADDQDHRDQLEQEPEKRGAALGIGRDIDALGLELGGERLLRSLDVRDLVGGPIRELAADLAVTEEERRRIDLAARDPVLELRERELVGAALAIGEREEQPQAD